MNIPRFFLKSVLKYDYLKTNKPIRIVDQFAETHPIDLDTLVKKEMLRYGIDNVRGGSYSTLFLNEHQTSLLKRELFPIQTNPEGACSDEIINQILDKYGEMSLNEAPSKKEKLKRDYEKYQKEKKQKKELIESIHINKYKKHLDWILKKCQEQISVNRDTVLYNIVNREDVKIYHEVLNMFHTIYQTFLTHYEKPVDNVYKDVLIKHPEFVLDDFMYHGYRTHLSVSIERVERLVLVYSFFLTFLENRIAELEFDVSSWGENAEQIFPRAIYFLGLY
jgi:hypothetical protein